MVPHSRPYRVAAQTIVESEELGETSQEIADSYGLQPDKVDAILKYWHSHHSELLPSR